MNPLYNSMQSSNVTTQFTNFMQQVKGQNPQQIINSLLSSGKITPEQYQQAQARAGQLGSQLEGVKNSFGFK